MHTIEQDCVLLWVLDMQGWMIWQLFRLHR